MTAHATGPYPSFWMVKSPSWSSSITRTVKYRSVKTRTQLNIVKIMLSRTLRVSTCLCFSHNEKG